MPDHGEQIIVLFTAGSIFVLVLSLWIGGVLFWSVRRSARKKRLETRLDLEEPQPTGTRTLRLWYQGRPVSTAAPAPSNRRSPIEILAQQFDDAGWVDRGGQVILLVGGLVILSAGLVTLITGNIFLALGVGLSVVMVFRLYMLGRITRREAVFDAQLTGAMELASRSLRAGHPLLGAFQLIAEETAPPVSTVFGEICQRQNMGVSLDTCLQEVAATSPSSNLRLFATSVAIQTRTGGNLAQLIDRLAAVSRDRLRLSRRIRVLTAQTQTSKRVLIVLPFLVFVVLNLLSPRYMTPFYDTTAGNVLLAVAAVSLTFGAWVMNRMAVLRY